MAIPSWPSAVSQLSTLRFTKLRQNADSSIMRRNLSEEQASFCLISALFLSIVWPEITSRENALPDHAWHTTFSLFYTFATFSFFLGTITSVFMILIVNSCTDKVLIAMFNSDIVHFAPRFPCFCIVTGGSCSMLGLFPQIAYRFRPEEWDDSDGLSWNMLEWSFWFFFVVCLFLMLFAQLVSATVVRHLYRCYEELERTAEDA